MITAATMTPASANTEPTDRSMPAVTMTNVIPSASTAFTDTCNSTMVMLPRVKKPGTLSAATRTSRARARPTP